ncbi:MAG TPA: DMT family transporter [Candidatus Polarisedimenticolaceae bacterium]|nr:DMT family transporter [Candidatus Polarisedimenticolaceae bacterium]
MQALILAVLAGLCWGVGELCTKSVLHGHRIGPMTAIAVRSTVALPVLWIAWAVATRWLALEPRPQWRALETGDVLKLTLGSGLTAGAAGMICFYAALNLDDVSRIKPIAFTVAPAVAVVLGWLLLHEAMTARKALAVGLILLGVVLLTGTRTSR